MMKNRVITLMLIVLIACSTYVACSGKDDRAEIRELIAKGEALAEAHDISGLLDLTADDFRAMPMDLDRMGMRGVLWRTFNYYGPLDILYPLPDITVHENAHDASTSFPLLIVKKERTIPGLDKFRDDPKAWIDTVGENTDLYRLRLQLSNRGGSWLVTQAVLERFAGLGFE